jgi:hypothetical protein
MELGTSNKLYYHIIFGTGTVTTVNVKVKTGLTVKKNEL